MNVIDKNFALNSYLKILIFEIPGKLKSHIYGYNCFTGN